jgi:hypothetical protein
MAYQHPQDKAMRLEDLIRTHLTTVRKQNPTNYMVSTLALYELVASWNELPTGHFNKIIGDMKRVGIVGTANTTKGGALVFLSDVAWQSYERKNGIVPVAPPVEPQPQIDWAKVSQPKKVRSLSPFDTETDGGAQ